MTSHSQNAATPDAAREIVVWRLIEGMREIGVLLVALTPLDYLMQGRTGSRTAMVVLLSLGVLSFGLSVFLETRIKQ